MTTDILTKYILSVAALSLTKTPLKGAERIPQIFLLDNEGAGDTKSRR